MLAAGFFFIVSASLPFLVDDTLLDLSDSFVGFRDLSFPVLSATVEAGMFLSAITRAESDGATADQAQLKGLFLGRGLGVDGAEAGSDRAGGRASGRTGQKTTAAHTMRHGSIFPISWTA